MDKGLPNNGVSLDKTRPGQTGHTRRGRQKQSKKGKSTFSNSNNSRFATGSGKTGGWNTDHVCLAFEEPVFGNASFSCLSTFSEPELRLFPSWRHTITPLATPSRTSCHPKPPLRFHRLCRLHHHPPRQVSTMPRTSLSSRTSWTRWTRSHRS